MWLIAPGSALSCFHTFASAFLIKELVSDAPLP